MLLLPIVISRSLSLVFVREVKRTFKTDIACYACYINNTHHKVLTNLADLFHVG